MNKGEFLARLGERLNGLPQDELAERLTFFGEMIDDRVDDGLTEEEAIAQIGSVEEIAAQIVAENPLSGIAMGPARRLRRREIALLILGSPLWLPLLIAAVAVLLSAYIVLWALILSLWAAFLSIAVGALGGAAAGILAFCQGNSFRGGALLGAGLVLAGLAILLFSTGSTGSFTLKNVTAAGRISIERSTGGVRFEDCDAAELTIETTTGSVTGTLRSGKTFVVKTTTGSVRTPDTTGGRCEIATTTGRVFIEVR